MLPPKLKIIFSSFSCYSIYNLIGDVSTSLDMTIGELNMIVGELNMTAGELNMTVGEVNMTIGELNMTVGELDMTARCPTWLSGMLCMRA